MLASDLPKEGGFMRWVLAWCAAAILAAASSTADAAWYEAQSKHFIIYADQNPRQLQAFGTSLEQFDQAVRWVMHYSDPPPGDGNRLTVFVLPNVDAVQKMAGKQGGYIAGFYQPRAEGCLAFVPGFLNADRTGGLDAMAVFFHEYTHHLQLQNLDRPYPAWLIEGFATFMQTAQIQKDGSILLGAPPEERSWGLLSADSIPLPSLLTEGVGKLDDTRRDLFYGQGWLLTHYLYTAQSRSGQLTRYLDLLNSGSTQLDAAQQAFGDLKQLQHELTVYKHQSSLMGMRVGADHAQPGTVAIRPMSPGGAAVILLRADLKLHGAKKDAAAILAQQIRAVEAQYPGDELVEATLAEAQLDNANAAAAEVAADLALKSNPRNVEALIFKGRAVEDRVRETQSADKHQSFENARSLLIAANKLDTEDPEPLYEYYRSYLLEGLRPTDNAIAAMHYASDLVPQDMGLRMSSAVAYLNENKLTEARATLAPVAYSPHSEGAGEVARRLIAAIDAGKVHEALLELGRSSVQH